MTAGAGTGGKAARPPFRRTLRVVYPLKEGRIVLRTEQDWEKDIEADELPDGGYTFTFTVESEKPFLYFKPVLRVGDDLYGTPGANRLVLMTEPDTRPVAADLRRPSNSTRRASAGGTGFACTFRPATARTP